MSMCEIDNHDGKHAFFTLFHPASHRNRYPMAPTKSIQEKKMQVVTDDVSGLVEDLGGGGNHLGGGAGGGGGGGGNPDQALGISFEPALSP